MSSASLPPKEESTVDEKEAEQLRFENMTLKAKLEDSQRELFAARGKVTELHLQIDDLRRPKPTTNDGAAIDIDAIYAAVRERAARDPKLLALMQAVRACVST